MSINPRLTLDHEINRLYDNVILLGSKVEHATLIAVESLQDSDTDKARQAYNGDEEINTLRYQIENDVMVLIATQQPMARDIRILASVFEVANELERMGDYAKGIARIVLLTADTPLAKPIVDFSKMAEKTVSMLHRALQAFVDSDADAAAKIPQEDDEVDNFYKRLLQQLIDAMMEDKNLIGDANYLIWAGHNLERMADRVTNICERTIYVATGKMEEIKSPDDPQRSYG